MCKKSQIHHCCIVIPPLRADDEHDGGGGYHGLEIRSRRGGDDLDQRSRGGEADDEKRRRSLVASKLRDVEARSRRRRRAEHATMSWEHELNHHHDRSLKRRPPRVEPVMEETAVSRRGLDEVRKTHRRSHAGSVTRDRIPARTGRDVNTSLTRGHVPARMNWRRGDGLTRGSLRGLSPKDLTRVDIFPHSNFNVF